MEFAGSARAHREGSFNATAVVALSFVGGCGLLGVTFAPLVWSRKQVAAVLVVSGIAGLAFAAGVAAAKHSFPWFVYGELILCIAGGIFVVALAIKDYWKSRTSASLFLGLWVLGTFVFAGFINWTINARSVLPLIPAAAILLTRCFDDLPSVSKRTFVQVGIILFASALFSAWVTAGDSELANSERTAAALVYNKTHDKNGTVWFVGHWGFQYYLESLGVAPLDLTNPQAHSGDFVVIAENNSHFAQVLPAFIKAQENVELPLKSWATTISSELGAGFYASGWGPLPYAIGPVPAERYSIIQLGALPGHDQSR
jgi:hypothetical protein